MTDASTSQAVAAQAQSREQATPETPGPAPQPTPPPGANLHRTYERGAGVERLSATPYERKSTDPLYRKLRIYSVDPSIPRLEGAVVLVDVPYEPLQDGPVGKMFEVDDYDETEDLVYRPAQLDDPMVLIRGGYEPSPSNPQFHQQMVYAVCSNVYAAFRAALGRQLNWRAGIEKLKLRPHAKNMRNAYYDPDGKTIDFGYFPAKQSTQNTLPGGYVFTCLSHDVVAHELTHALLDGLRAEFSRPSGPDVIAFHEAFADLVAIFQRFSYREVVLNAIRRTRGDITAEGYLTDLARQFGSTSPGHAALRNAIGKEPNGQFKLYDENLEAHELGSILVAAVFDAFARVYQRKTERYVRLATQGTGQLPTGEMPYDLQAVLADVAAKLASQFLSICIRAIDYCPPVGLTFGDYLRALITADFDLVPDDRWDYRGALIEAFRQRNIYPRFVTSLTEDALLWRATRTALPAIADLSFAALKFRGDPGCVADATELTRQADVLGDFVSRPANLAEFGLVAADDPRLDGDRVSLPRIESIRSARRIGPNGQVIFDLVAEVTQSRTVRAREGCAEFTYYGGATIILDPLGGIRYAVVKSLMNDQRLERRRAFLLGESGQHYWTVDSGVYQPRPQMFQLLHHTPDEAASAKDTADSSHLKKRTIQMTDITAASAREFLAQLNLPEVNAREWGFSPEENPPFQLEATQKQAVVAGSDVVTFAPEVSVAHREEILNCALIAQWTADRDTDQSSNIVAWYNRYFEVLGILGWVVTGQQFKVDEAQGTGVEVHEAILKVATALLAGSTGLGLVVAALEAMKSMDSESPWIKIFDRESQKKKVTAFRMAGVEEDPHGQLTVSLIAFVLDASSVVNQILFFKIRTNEARFEHCSANASINSRLLDSIRQDLHDNVEGRAKNFLSSKNLPKTQHGA